MKPVEYSEIIVESYCPESRRGLRGEVHIRPLPGQYPFDSELHVACSKKLTYDYPVGTKFKIRAKLTQREDGAFYIYSNFIWPFEVVY